MGHKHKPLTIYNLARPRLVSPIAQCLDPFHFFLCIRRWGIGQAGEDFSRPVDVMDQHPSRNQDYITSHTIASQVCTSRIPSPRYKYVQSISLVHYIHENPDSHPDRSHPTYRHRPGRIFAVFPSSICLSESKHCPRGSISIVAVSFEPSGERVLLV